MGMRSFSRRKSAGSGLSRTFRNCGGRDSVLECGAPVPLMGRKAVPGGRRKRRRSGRTPRPRGGMSVATASWSAEPLRRFRVGGRYQEKNESTAGECPRKVLPQRNRTRSRTHLLQSDSRFRGIQRCRNRSAAPTASNSQVSGSGMAGTVAGSAGVSLFCSNCCLVSSTTAPEHGVTTCWRPARSVAAA